MLKKKITGLLVGISLLVSVSISPTIFAAFQPGTYGAGAYDSGVYSCKLTSDCNGATSTTGITTSPTKSTPTKTPSTTTNNPAIDNGSGTSNQTVKSPVDKQAASNSHNFSLGWILSTIGFAFLFLLGIFIFIAAARRRRNQTPGPY